MSFAERVTDPDWGREASPNQEEDVRIAEDLGFLIKTSRVQDPGGSKIAD